jgi:hypothetical protein
MTDHPAKMQAELIKELNGLPPMCAIETAFQAGADQELEACCEWLNRCGFYQTSNHLRATRRPKPPSVKQQALSALDEIDGYAIDQLKAYTVHDELKAHVDTVRRALEALPND